ncbi:hypothetical protein, partial [Bilophila wadsworthia]|uniref:hypothetical protein n=1 Tax=Bilophila wadsworthia TaxID=35833 RepID=UPI003AB2B6F8
NGMNGMSDGTDMIAMYCQGQETALCKRYFCRISSETPYFLRKENLDPLPGTFLIAVYAAGHYSACNPPNGISFISTRRGWTTPFLSFPARSPLCPQHLPVRLI